jgi:hypothetical protein
LPYRDSSVHAARLAITINGSQTSPGREYGADIFHGQPPGRPGPVHAMRDSPISMVLPQPTANRQGPIASKKPRGLYTARLLIRLPMTVPSRFINRSNDKWFQMSPGRNVAKARAASWKTSGGWPARTAVAKIDRRAA